MMLVLEAVRKAIDDRVNKRISTDDLSKLEEFVLKSSYFEFNGKAKKQILGTALGT